MDPYARLCQKHTLQHFNQPRTAGSLDGWFTGVDVENSDTADGALRKGDAQVVERDNPVGWLQVKALR
jgi:hypothetical protein